eukprot:1376783-Amorphochlora_amoeboformis.AAC.1
MASTRELVSCAFGPVSTHTASHLFSLEAIAADRSTVDAGSWFFHADPPPHTNRKKKKSRSDDVSPEFQCCIPVGAPHFLVFKIDFANFYVVRARGPFN